MRKIISHFILLVVLWLISHASPVESLWQIYPIIWFALVINSRLSFLAFLFISCGLGFIADFEIMPPFADTSHGLFWGISSIFLIIIGGIQRLISHSTINNIIYISLAHEAYRFFINSSYFNDIPNWSGYTLGIILNLIFLLLISITIFLFQERFNPQ